MRLKIQPLLDDAKQSTGRIASLVEAVRSIARQENAETADIDVHEQFRSALGVLDHKLKNIRVTQSFSSESGHVRGYPSELAQVWVNLLDNAADAVNGGGEIAIRTRRDDNQTVVEIIDNGPGIPPQNLSHIFEPFFTTKVVVRERVSALRSARASWETGMAGRSSRIESRRDAIHRAIARATD